MLLNKSEENNKHEAFDLKKKKKKKKRTIEKEIVLQLEQRKNEGYIYRANQKFSSRTNTCNIFTDQNNRH